MPKNQVATGTLLGWVNNKSKTSTNPGEWFKRLGHSATYCNEKYNKKEMRKEHDDAVLCRNWKEE